MQSFQMPHTTDTLPAVENTIPLAAGNVGLTMIEREGRRKMLTSARGRLPETSAPPLYIIRSIEMQMQAESQEAIVISLPSIRKKKESNNA